MDTEKQELIATLTEDIRTTPPGFVRDMMVRALQEAQGEEPGPYDVQEMQDE